MTEEQVVQRGLGESWLPGTLLAQLDEVGRERLLRTGSLVTTHARQSLMLQGDASTDVFLLLAGWYKVTVTSHDGQATLLSIRTGGDLVGEVASISRRLRMATVTSVGAGLARRISEAEFSRFVDTHPGAALHIMRVISEKLRWATDRRQDTGRTVRGRVTRALLDLATTYGVWQDDAIVLEAALTQQDIADLTGTSSTSVERVFKALRAKGVLSTGYRRLTILDIAALARFADELG